MKLYHGTNIHFEHIELAKSRPNKDFGKGFYLSADLQQAKEMAEHKYLQEGGTPIVQTYLFDENLLTGNELKVLRFDSYSEEWVRFILKNRTNRTGNPCHDYDIVTGPIADDKVGVQLFRYLNQYIGIKELIANLKYKRMTEQYFFGTERAIKHLKNYD